MTPHVSCLATSLALPLHSDLIPFSHFVQPLLLQLSVKRSFSEKVKENETLFKKLSPSTVRLTTTEFDIKNYTTSL